MKKSGALLAAALACAAYLSVALTALGINKFYYLLAGGRKFATFPDSSYQLQIGLPYLLLSILYLAWFLETKRLYTFSRFVKILKIALPFLLLALLAYPLGNDVYIYLHAGLMNLSDANPFLVRAGSFTSELSPFVDWGQTSTYGPVSQLLFTLSAATIAIHPLFAVYVFKAICLALHLLNGYIVWRSIEQIPERGKVTLAYLVNPLLLMEQVGSAHVDVLVSTSFILFTACSLQRRYISGSLALWVGFLSKTVPLIWMPIVGVFLIRQRRWQALLGITLLSLGLIVTLWFTVLPGLPAWSSLLNPGVSGQYQSSWHAIVKFGLDLVRIFSPNSLDLLEQKQILLKLSQLSLVGFAGFYGWMTWRGYRRSAPSEEKLLEDLGWVTLVLLLVATPWLMPWYASIVITIAALIPRAQIFGLTSLVFGLSSSAQYVLYGHNSLKALISIGLPLLAWVLATRLLTARSLMSVSNPPTSTAQP